MERGLGLYCWFYRVNRNFCQFSGENRGHSCSHGILILFPVQVWDVDYSKIELRMGSPPDVVTCVAKVDKEKESKFILVNDPPKP